MKTMLARKMCASVCNRGISYGAKIYFPRHQSQTMQLQWEQKWMLPPKVSVAWLIVKVQIYYNFSVIFFVILTFFWCMKHCQRQEPRFNGPSVSAERTFPQFLFPWQCERLWMLTHYTAVFWKQTAWLKYSRDCCFSYSEDHLNPLLFSRKF